MVNVTNCPIITTADDVEGAEVNASVPDNPEGATCRVARFGVVGTSPPGMVPAMIQKTWSVIPDPVRVTVTVPADGDAPTLHAQISLIILYWVAPSIGVTNRPTGVHAVANVPNPVLVGAYVAAGLALLLVPVAM
jgi:hypothetical protein